MARRTIRRVVHYAGTRLESGRERESTEVCSADKLWDLLSQVCEAPAELPHYKGFMDEVTQELKRQILTE